MLTLNQNNVSSNKNAIHLSHLICSFASNFMIVRGDAGIWTHLISTEVMGRIGASTARSIAIWRTHCMQVGRVKSCLVCRLMRFDVTLSRKWRMTVTKLFQAVQERCFLCSLTQTTNRFIVNVIPHERFGHLSAVQRNMNTFSVSRF